MDEGAVCSRTDSCLAVPDVSLTCRIRLQDNDAEEQKSQLRDISAFLAPTGLAELKFIRRLSTMCSQTYLMSKLTVRTQFLSCAAPACLQTDSHRSRHLQERTLHRRLGLRLVTSSTALLSHKAPKRSLREIVEYADAMAVTRQDAEQAQADTLSTEESPAMKVCRLLAGFTMSAATWQATRSFAKAK